MLRTVWIAPPARENASAASQENNFKPSAKRAAVTQNAKALVQFSHFRAIRSLRGPDSLITWNLAASINFCIQIIAAV